MKKGFTLIELLVVISIIALLSSIVIVVASSARDKARIAAGLQFSSSIQHVLGSEIAAEWEFEDNLNDTSGYENDGQWEGGGSESFVDSDLPIGGKALYFNGSSYVEIPVSYPSTLALRNTDSLTIEAWIKPENVSGYRSVVARRAGTCGLYIYEGKVNFVIHRSWGVDLVSIPVTVGVGNWYHLVGTFDHSLLGTDEAVRVFVNGEEKSSHDDSEIYSANWPIFIGVFSSLHGSKYYYFQGIIDEVRIYKQALTQAQIKKLYVEGTRERGLLTQN